MMNSKTRSPFGSPGNSKIQPSPVNVHPSVFTNPKTEEPYITVAKDFARAQLRAGITTGDVTFHFLRHTVLIRIGARHSDHTVMAISGHSTTRMLARYVHPTQELKISALDTVTFETKMDTKWTHGDAAAERGRREVAGFLRKSGGRREARTRDLRVANAALSQLS